MDNFKTKTSCLWWLTYMINLECYIFKSEKFLYVSLSKDNENYTFWQDNNNITFTVEFNILVFLIHFIVPITVS